MQHTKQKDGYRWELMDGTNYDGRIKATPQAKYVLDGGRVGYRYCNPVMYFDNLKQRDAFVKAFSAKDIAMER